jgi:hypothetical protein
MTKSVSHTNACLHGQGIPRTTNVKTPVITSCGHARLELLTNLLYTVPGPKMLWEFGELGYDFSINYCTRTVLINNSCRVDPKPIRWDYLQRPLPPSAARRDRRPAAICVQTTIVFETSDFQLNLGKRASAQHLPEQPRP